MNLGAISLLIFGVFLGLNMYGQVDAIHIEQMEQEIEILKKISEGYEQTIDSLYSRINDSGLSEEERISYSDCQQAKYDKLKAEAESLRDYMRVLIITIDALHREVEPAKSNEKE